MTDTREAVAAAILATATDQLANSLYASEPVAEDRLIAQALADAAIAAFLANPPEWLRHLVVNLHRRQSDCMLTMDGVRHSKICAAVPESVRRSASPVAAGIEGEAADA